MSFPARYAGRCVNCGQWFDQGTLIDTVPAATSADAAGWAHLTCPPKFVAEIPKDVEARREARRVNMLRRRADRLGQR